MLYNHTSTGGRQPPAIGCQPVHGPVVALMLTGQEGAPGDGGTQTTRIYGVSASVCVWLCMSVCVLSSLWGNKRLVIVTEKPEHLNIADKLLVIPTVSVLAKFSITKTLAKPSFHYPSNMAVWCNTKNVSESGRWLCPFFSQWIFGSSERGRDQSSFMSLSVYRASKSKMRLISEAVKVRLGMDQVSPIHPILPEQPLLTGYQSMYPPNEHCKQAV